MSPTYLSPERIKIRFDVESLSIEEVLQDLNGLIEKHRPVGYKVSELSKLEIDPESYTTWNGGESPENWIKSFSGNVIVFYEREEAKSNG